MRDAGVEVIHFHANIFSFKLISAKSATCFCSCKESTELFSSNKYYEKPLEIGTHEHKDYDHNEGSIYPSLDVWKNQTKKM